MKNKTHHDYIFKKNKLIRNFDEMYKDFDDPHGQKLSFNNFSHNFYLYTMKSLMNFEKKIRWVDFGCGMGLFTQRIKEVFGNIKLTGVDISPEVIKKISIDDINFLSGDILDTHFIKSLNKFKVISLFETLYYFKKSEINNVIKNIDLMLEKDGYLIISYHLPDSMNYGTYVRELKDLETLFINYELLYGNDFIDNTSKIYNGNTFGRHLFSIFKKN